MVRVTFVVCVVFLMGGCVAQQLNAYKKAIAEPIDVWKAKVEVRDDPMETMVVYSTEPAIFDMKNAFTGEAIDVFLRGSRDKQSGLATIHGYAYLSMNNGTWPRPYQINHGKPLRTYEANNINSDVDCSGSDVWGGCRYTYHTTFPIPISEFKRLADANYSLEDMQTGLWQFRIKFQAYEDFNHGLSVQEMLSIYETMLEDGAFFVD